MGAKPQDVFLTASSFEDKRANGKWQVIRSVLVVYFRSSTKISLGVLSEAALEATDAQR